MKFWKIRKIFIQGTQQVKEAEIQDPRSDVALRKDLEKWMQEKRAKTKSRITGSRKPEKIQPETGIIQPEYEIKQSKNVNMQDYVGNGCQGLYPYLPDVITINMPTKLRDFLYLYSFFHIRVGRFMEIA